MIGYIVTQSFGCRSLYWRSVARLPTSIRRGQPVGAHVPSWCSSRKLSRRKPVLAGALKISPSSKRMTSSEALKNAELHQHQQHGKADATARAEQTRLVRQQISPRERNKPDRSPRESRVQRCDHPNRSAGSARRRLLIESKAEAAAMAMVAPNTAAMRVPDISTGSKVSSRITA